MAQQHVVLIGFRDQENLGLGYLAAVLLQHGFDVEMLDFRLEPQAILERVRQADPLLVGLSIIFQYYTPAFARLVRFLRANGVACTICAGGHYPSLCPEEVLQAIPGLDCIVRFEGEFTLLKMAQRLRDGLDWRDLPSLAYRTEPAGFGTTPLRPLIENLDALPPPHRWGTPDQCLGIPMANVLASRGCVRDCSFCSIRQFYSMPPGPLRRTRSPDNVVREMRQLGEQHGTRIFLFQDDDFALKTKRDKTWAGDFVACLNREGLERSFVWKISCRADEVEPIILAQLQRAGLSLVYLGIESGNAEGLQTLNKHITVDMSRQAVKTLKQLGLSYEFGFMLFDPSSTIDRVLENARFLDEICGDGSAPIPFCRMKPYAGTDVERQLRLAGRLRGSLDQPDYEFLDARLDDWFAYLLDVFDPWAMRDDSLLTQIRMTRFEANVVERFCPEAKGLGEYKAQVTAATAQYNNEFCRIVVDSAPVDGRQGGEVTDKLRAIRLAAHKQRDELAARLTQTRGEFFAANRSAPV